MDRKAALTFLLCLLILGASAREGRQGSPLFDSDYSLRVPGLSAAAGLCCGDLNGDKKLDLIMLSGQSGEMMAVLNVDGKTFVAERDGATFAGTGAIAAAMGDYNEDGKLDVAVCHLTLGEIWIMFGKGNGSFQEPVRIKLPVDKAHGHTIIAADFNRDKHLDLLATEASENKAIVLLGDGKGGFTIPAGGAITTERYPYGAAVGDFDGDGNLDFGCACWFGKAVCVFLGDGKGGFRAAPGSPTTGYSAPISLAATDFDGDGKLDLVLGNNAARSFQVLKGDGKGGFKTGEIADLEAEGTCSDPIVGDLNGDGKPDVIATAPPPTFCYWLNQGGGKFGKAQILNCTPGASSICVADINGDGVPDLAVGTWNLARAFLWIGKKP